MKVLVTGSSGFVGAAVLRRLLGDGQNTVCAAARVADAPYGQKTHRC